MSDSRNYTSDASPPIRRSGEPREAVVRYIAERERLAGRDGSVDRAEALLDLTNALVGAGGSLDLAYAMARLRPGALDDGSLTAEAARAATARLRGGFRVD